MFHQIIVDECLGTYFNSFNAHKGQVLFYSVNALSFLIGSYLSNIISRKKVLFYWTLSTIISSLLLLLFQSEASTYFLLSLSSLTLGWGQPALFAALAESTNYGNRGRTSSINQFLIFLFVPVIFIIFRIISLTSSQLIVVNVIFRCIALSVITIGSFNQEVLPQRSWRFVVSSKKTILYLLPWVFCSISNGILIFFDNSLANSPELQSINEIGQYILYFVTSIFGLISGFMADRSGRKQPLILGFIALGVSYAFVGVSTSINNLLIMIVLSGIGWGFITVILQWVVFGDLASSGSYEKYYALALTVYPLFESIFQFLEGIIGLTISPSFVALFVSIIMFISVFPLLLVTETLPDDLIQDKRFKNYLQKVLDIMEEE